jgi:hypothetical protein
MPTFKEFSDNFDGRKLPDELLQILEFQSKSGGDVFSEGFGLSSNVKQGLYYGWSKNPDFLNNLFPFAMANRSGSFYAFWNNSTTANLNDMPIAIFGDEGGEHIVAEDFLQLLKILTYDSEPMVDHDAVMYYKDEEQYRPSPKLDSFKRWIKEAFDIDSIDSPDELVNLAQKKYQGAFNDWKLKYLKV